MEMELPKNWVETNLDTILVRITNGSSLKQQEAPLKNYYPITRIETIADETIDLKRVKYVLPTEKDIERFSLKKGDILFSHINSDKHLGKTAIFDLDITVIHGINLLLMRTVDQYNSRLLHYLFQYYRFRGKFREVAQRAVNQSSINQKKLKQFPIPLPPLPEQNRIVAKLDAHFEQLEVINANLEKIPVLLKHFRQQVLNKVFDSDHTLKKLVEICEKIQDGAHHSPQERYDTPGKNLYPYVTSKNIRNNYMILKNLEYVTEEYHNTIYPRCKPEFGDVLLTKDGANTGNVTLNVLNEPFSLLSSVCLIKTKKEILQPTYLKYYLQSSVGFNKLIGEMTGTAIKRIVLKKIKATTIPVPSIKEQVKATDKIDELFKIADEIENQYGLLKSKIEKLPQSLLHKAFKGELAPQLEGDGDARELLREIKEINMMKN